MKLSASVLILHPDDGRALALRRSGTDPWMPLHWNLPGGGVDPGETFPQAAAREAWEEAGVPLSEDDLQVLRVIKRSDLCHITYWAWWDGTTPQLLDGEHDEWAWVQKRTIPRYPWIPSVRPFLSQVLP